jgi:hypothetical protein
MPTDDMELDPLYYKPISMKDESGQTFYFRLADVTDWHLPDLDARTLSFIHVARLPNGVWVMCWEALLSETIWKAETITDAEAVRWLQASGYDPPEDLEAVFGTKNLGKVPPPLANALRGREADTPSPANASSSSMLPSDQCSPHHPPDDGQANGRSNEGDSGQAEGTGSGSAQTNTKRKKRGRPPCCNLQRRGHLFNDWKASGYPKIADFARARGLNTAEVTKDINNHGKWLVRKVKKLRTN